MKERNALAIPGLVMVVVLLALFAAGLWLFVSSIGPDDGVSAVQLIVGLLVAAAAAIGASGFVVIQPNQSAVVTFLGSYLGTVHTSGFTWTWPLTSGGSSRSGSRTSTARSSR